MRWPYMRDYVDDRINAVARRGSSLVVYSGPTRLMGHAYGPLMLLMHQ